MSMHLSPNTSNKDLLLTQDDHLDGTLIIGVPEIDRQHHAMFVLLDKLQALGPQPFDESASELYGQFGETLIKHFSDEEAYLRSLKLPAEMLLKHLQEHNDFLGMYVDINMTLMAGRKPSATEIAGSLRTWVIRHVIECDLEIRKFSPPPV